MQLDCVLQKETLDGDAGTIRSCFTVLEAEVSSDWLFYGMTGQMSYQWNSITSTRSNAWWNNNAQLTVVGFEGTKRYSCV